MSIPNDFEKHGGSYLLSEGNARDYIRKNNPELIGRPDAQFMIPSNQMDDLLAKHPSDPRAWEKQLGLDEGSLGEHPVRVDVYSPQDYNLREPTYNLSGSNDKFTGDGRTAGGYDEAVTNQFPNPTLTGNENIGKVEPVNIDLSTKQSAASSIEAMPPDRRSNWPSPSLAPSDADLEKARTSGVNLDGLLNNSPGTNLNAQSMGQAMATGGLT